MGEKKKVSPLLIIVIVLALVLAFLMGIAGAVLVGSRDGNHSAEAEETDRDEKEDEEDEEEADEEEDEEGADEEDGEEIAGETDGVSGSEPAFEDLLADYDVLYPGEIKGGERESAVLAAQLMDSEGIDPASILMVNASDFDCNGTVEAFIFAGTYNGNESDPEYVGDFWFCDGSECSKIEMPGVESYCRVDGMISCDGRKCATAQMYVTTGGPVYVWSVYDGKPEECELSGLVGTWQREDGEIIAVDSTYDTMYDPEMGGFLGHSWKHYYFYYDKAADCFREYGGTCVDAEEIDDVCGFDLREQMEKAGKEVMNAYIRDNGILNVNYRVVLEPGSDIEYGNANYDCRQGQFVDAWGEDVHTLEGSDFGGTYVKALRPDIAVYSGGDETEAEDLQLMVTSRADVLVEAGDVILIGTPMGSTEQRTVVVDEYTDFTTSGGSKQVNSEGRNPLSYLQSRVSEDPADMSLLGVYDLKVRDGHAEEMKEEIDWWD